MKLFAIQKLVPSNYFYISYMRKYRLKIEGLVISFVAFKMISDYGGRWSKLREVVDQFLLDKPEELLTFASPNAILVKM